MPTPDMAEWLRDIDLGQYESVLRENAVDFDVLPDIDEADLEKLGIPLGHRKRLLRAIARLSAEPPVAPLVAPAIAPEWRSEGPQRRQLTILFCDVVASTALSTRLDPEDLHQILAAYTTQAREVLQRFDGFIARFLGDGILAYFGYPQAHEHDPEQAVRAALQLIATVSRLEMGGHRLQLRIGIATGLVVVGDLAEGQDHDVVGETPNLAARLQEATEPNTVTVAASTRHLLGSLFEVRELGPRMLKGFPEPVNAWRVLAESAHESRFDALRSTLTPLVGRDEDLATLGRRWRQACSGVGQIALISGEAGLGKSRILSAFEDQLDGERHLRLRCFCSPHHQHSALFPIIAHLENAARFARTDGPDAKLAKLRRLLSASGEASPGTLSLLADLLDLPIGDPSPQLDAHEKRELTLTALARLLEGQTRDRPVVLIFEDVHWIDATSLELLDIIAERTRRLPLFLCITFRPEFEPPWSGQANVTTLALNRLYHTDAAAIVARVAGDKPLPAELLERIVERSDGIPLFIEELTKALIESGHLREVDGRYALDEPVRSFAIPSTLQSSLMARLDRLSPVKEVAQIGAAIGRSFSYEFLAAVARRTEVQLRDALDQLAAAGLIVQRGVPPNSVITFKHALVQDAAYETLLRAQRQDLHARIANVLEGRFPELAMAQPEVVAHHYTEARLIEPAIGYWRLAGERALRRSADVEGVRHLSRAIELLMSRPEGPERDRIELGLRLALGPAVRAVKGNGADEVLQVFSRAHELLDGAATTKERMIVLQGTWSVRNMRGEMIAAQALAEQCLALATDSADPDAAAMANLLLGHNLWGMGRFREARDYLEQTLDYCAPGKEQHPELRFSYNLGVAGIAFLALALWPLGLADRALAEAARAVQLAHGTGHVPLIALVSYCDAFLKGLLGADPDAAAAAADETLAYCLQHGVSAYVPWASFCRGAAAARRGESLTAIRAMREALAAAENAKAGFLRPILLGQLAASSAAAGDAQLGLEFVNQAFEAVEHTEERSFQAELHRIRGELFRGLGEESAAEAELEHALQLARRQEALLWELRAATSIARRDRNDAGRDLLVSVYRRFAEGFETPDLQTARAVLAELG